MVLTEENLETEINAALSAENIFVITDKNVQGLYGKYFTDKRIYVIEPGEDSKNLTVLADVCKKMLESGANRLTTVVAVGGGVVGDLAGFCAAVFMRGVEWINIPTTLLSQVDSAIGGKTAVDLDDYKNILGAFHSPKEIIISTHFLQTLNERERLCGIGEIVKTMFLCKDLFALLEPNISKLLAFDSALILSAVKLCAEFKEKIVYLDEKDTKGIRKALNVGHTIGHALEKADCHRLSHGEYVLWGMLYENYTVKKYIPMEEYYLINSILRKVLKGRTLKFDSAEVADAALFDKKNENGKISIVAVESRDKRKELFFTKKDIFEGLEQCKKEYSL